MDKLSIFNSFDIKCTWNAKKHIIRLPGRLKYDLADAHDSFLRPTSMPDNRAHGGIVTGLSRPRGICVVEASVVLAALMLFSDGAVDIDPAASWENGGPFVSVRIDCFIDVMSWNKDCITETFPVGPHNQTTAIQCD